MAKCVICGEEEDLVSSGWRQCNKCGASFCPICISRKLKTKGFLSRSKTCAKCGAPMLDRLKTTRFREEEKIIMALKPHPLAFLDFYAIFLYLASLGGIFILFNAQMNTAIQGFAPTDWSRNITLSAIWLACLIIPFIVVAIVKIVWRWLLLPFSVAVIGAVFTYHFQIATFGMQYPALLIGAIGIGLVDIYRRKFHFFITDQRLVIELDFISEKRREILYSKISDLVIERGWLGRVFNYGSIIPITESGFGLGEDVSAVTVGTTGSPLPKGPKVHTAVTGGRTVSIPRGRNFYVLFGVRKPSEAYDIISQLVGSREEAPYLKRIASDVGFLAKEAKERSKDEKTRP